MEDLIDQAFDRCNIKNDDRILFRLLYQNAGKDVLKFLRKLNSELLTQGNDHLMFGVYIAYVLAYQEVLKEEPEYEDFYNPDYLGLIHLIKIIINNFGDVPFTYEIFFYDYFSFHILTAFRDLDMRLTFQEAMKWRVYRYFLTRGFPKEKYRTSLIPYLLLG